MGDVNRREIVAGDVSWEDGGRLLVRGLVSVVMHSLVI